MNVWPLKDGQLSATVAFVGTTRPPDEVMVAVVEAAVVEVAVVEVVGVAELVAELEEAVVAEAELIEDVADVVGNAVGDLSVVSDIPYYSSGILTYFELLIPNIPPMTAAAAITMNNNIVKINVGILNPKIVLSFFSAPCKALATSKDFHRSFS